MKRTAAGVTVVCIATAAVLLADAPRVSRFALSQLEARIDGLLDKDTCNVLGNTRGVYLDNYGAVFTTLVSLRTEVPNPFNNFTPKKIAEIHATKMKMMPAVREKMRQSLLLMASSSGLDAVPPDEQVVFDVTLFYYASWEDMHGLPKEILMQSSKRKLLDVQQGRVPMAQLDALLKVQEQ